MPRKYCRKPFSVTFGCYRFNEAGADAPEIQPIPKAHVRERSGFNEAGADAPEIPPVSFAIFERQNVALQ